MINLSNDIAALGLDAAAVELGLVSFESIATLVGSYEPGSTELADALRSFTPVGGTNYEEALQRVIESFTAADATNDTNLVYFLSDGFPNEGGDFTDEAQALEDLFGAEIIAVGMGENSSTLDALNQIDNTGGAQTVTSTDELDALLSGSALSVDVIDFVVTVNGIEQTEIDETDLVEGPFGYSMPATGIDNLDPTEGADNEIIAQITLSDGSVFDLEAHVIGGGYLAEGDLLTA